MGLVGCVASSVCLFSCRECKRTQGVSTTDLVGRMLLMTKAHHSNIVSQAAGAAPPTLLHSAAPSWALLPPCARAMELSSLISCLQGHRILQATGGQGLQNPLLVSAWTCGEPGV